MCVFFFRFSTKTMEGKLIGRQAEQEILGKSLASNEAEMVAVIGRRRVGKTFLVRSFFGEQIVFEITGTQNAPYAEQIQNFVQQLNNIAKSTIPIQTPKNWLEAFHLLTLVLENLQNGEKTGSLL